MFILRSFQSFFEGAFKKFSSQNYSAPFCKCKKGSERFGENQNKVVQPNLCPLRPNPLPFVTQWPWGKFSDHLVGEIASTTLACSLLIRNESILFNNKLIYLFGCIESATARGIFLAPWGIFAWGTQALLVVVLAGLVALRHVGFQFLDQGSNPRPLLCKEDS